MALNLLNLNSMILALFDEISTMTTRLGEYKRNLTDMNISSLTTISTTVDPSYPDKICYEECTYYEEEDSFVSTTALVTALAVNITLTTYSKFSNTIAERTSVAPPANYYQRPSTIKNFGGKHSESVTNSPFFGQTKPIFDYEDTSPSYRYNYKNASDDYYTENVTNSTLFGETYPVVLELENTTSSYNYKDSNSTLNYDNETGIYFITNNISNSPIPDDLTDASIDYLDYILFQSDYDPENVTDIIAENATLNYTQEAQYTEISTAITNSSPSGNSDSTEGNERFVTESTSIDPSTSEVSTTDSTYTDLISTTTEDAFFSTTVNNLTRKNCSQICHTNPAQQNRAIQQKVQRLNYTAKRDLRKLCWETMFGQELVKLTVMDLLFTILSTMGTDFIRAIFVRYMNRCWCWDLEKKFPQYGDFKVAENILHLVNNQGMVWMGMFFSPGIVLLNAIKLYILMYFRGWIVLSCNVPHEIIFRASRSNNFYYALLLMMLFLCVLPVGYAIVWIKPSWHCGPFSDYDKISQIFTKTIKGALPQFENVLNYIASPGTVIPLLVLLILVIYYLVSLTAALREANNDLKIQLRRERTEERRKMFQIADRRRRGGSGGSGESNPYNKWKCLLERLPSGKSLDETPRMESDDQEHCKEEKENRKTKDFFSKLMKKALGKSSTSEDEINHNVDDGTDTEQHESLPEDGTSIKDSRSPQVHKPVKATISSGSTDLQRAIASAFSAKRNQKKLENLRGSTDSSETKHVQIQQHPPKHTSSSRHSSFDGRRPLQSKKSVEASTSRQDSSSSLWSDNIPVITISKTESAENILDHSPQNQPKAASVEATPGSSPKLHGKESPTSIANVNHKSRVTGDKFKPKIKYALKKQSSEIDEDMIFHFNKDAEGAIYSSPGFSTVREELPSVIMPSAPSYEELMIDKSSSDDTETKESSQDTILNAPYIAERTNSHHGGTSKQNEHMIKKRESTTSVGTERSSTDGNSTQTESSSYYRDSTSS